ncbi:(ZYRO0C07128g) [Zygosaccharomyces parabailii]|nr:(ZYRO0C07128g) [Zygosaccharomyces parabailii]CDH09296.1 uncharacterized protein ZBAI_01080 [Zygosaccharomyces bailii ISA1307]
MQSTNTLQILCPGSSNCRPDASVNQLASEVMDSSANYCFEDDLVASKFHNKLLTIEDNSKKFKDHFTGISLSFPKKPANCVVTRNSVNAFIFQSNKRQTNFAEKETKNFVQEVFKINYDVSLTNARLASRNSELQMENINLLESLGKTKLENSRKLQELNNVICKLKDEKYQLSLNLSDLTLSNYDYIKATSDLRNQNVYLTRRLTQDIPDLMKNLEVASKGNTETDKYHNSNTKKYKRESNHFQENVEDLIEEVSKWRCKCKQLEDTSRLFFHDTLNERITELKQLQAQLHADKLFIKRMQYLQMQREIYSSSRSNMPEHHDDLNNKLFNSQWKHSELVTDSKPHKYRDMDDYSEGETPQENPDLVFDCVSPETERSESSYTSKWRRFYKKGSLSHSPWSKRLCRKRGLFCPVPN